jgi:hypothetical protein
MTERGTMAAISSTGQVYLGSTAILRPGKRVPPDADVTGTAASALVNAWQMADVQGGIPHIYALEPDLEGLLVVGDVLVTGRLAEEALSLGPAGDDGSRPT